MMSKCHPSRGIVKVEQTLAWPLFPWLSEYERKHRIGARAYFDCTWPVHWDASEVPARMSFKEAYPAEIQEMTLDKLLKFGFTVGR
jgi:4-hydroxy-3-polyprenylbenzoate decarboxylase